MNTYFYFGYGANLCHDLMIGRRPDSVFLESAVLNNYRFAFDTVNGQHTNAVANIIPDSDEQVWGGLYKISRAGLASLDLQECYPNDYQRKWVDVRGVSGNRFGALVYFRAPQETGFPSEEYLNIIRHGMDDCKLPEFYRTALAILTAPQHLSAKSNHASAMV